MTQMWANAKDTAMQRAIDWKKYCVLSRKFDIGFMRVEHEFSSMRKIAQQMIECELVSKNPAGMQDLYMASLDTLRQLVPDADPEIAYLLKQRNVRVENALPLGIETRGEVTPMVGVLSNVLRADIPLLWLKRLKIQKFTPQKEIGFQFCPRIAQTAVQPMPQDFRKCVAMTFTQNEKEGKSPVLLRDVKQLFDSCQQNGPFFKELCALTRDMKLIRAGPTENPWFANLFYRELEEGKNGGK